MRDPAHDTDPRPEGAEPRQGGDADGGGEHHERVAEPHGDERAEPQPEIRSPPRHGGREEPPDDDQQVSQPAGHPRSLPAHAFRATAATASTVRVSVNPPPAVTGSMTGQPAMRPITAMSAAPATTGTATRWSVGLSPARAARPAVSMPPIHATNVPSIHQIGRYHQVLRPPTASHVHG